MEETLTSLKGTALVDNVSLKGAINNAASPSKNCFEVAGSGLADFPVTLSLHGSGSTEVRL
jgi:hypothetical protein